MTDEFKCAFSGTLIGDQFGCEYAKTVVRRGGAETACTHESAHHTCGLMFENMKQAALPAFGVEDDLLTMPHSVLVKVQFGGLLGLQRISGDAGNDPGKVKNIFQLIATTTNLYKNPEDIPYQDFVEAIVAFKLPRRGRRRS